MRRKLLSILALLLIAAGSAWAERVNVTFSANGKSIVKEKVELDYTYWCNYSWRNGELDEIIRYLYDFEDGYCWVDGVAPSASGSNITAGRGDSSGEDPEYNNDMYITLAEGFRGPATVTCQYDKVTKYWEETIGDWSVDYKTYDITLTITATPIIDVTSVSLPASATLDVGQTTTLTATVTPGNATDKTVTWSSSNPSVATVSNSGVVTAVATGNATITATATNGTADTSDDKTATCTVTVNPVAVTGVSLPSSASLNVGQSKALTATIAPSNATNKSVSWTTSNDDVAIVNANGVVTAVGLGTATITVTTTDGGYTATCTVTNAQNGRFTVSAGGDQVLFAQGNLQAVCASADGDPNTQETFTWRFAEHQWDYIGGNYDGGSVTPTGNNFIDGNGSVSAAGTVDLFNWVGASSTLTGDAAYGLNNTWGMGYVWGQGNDANEGLKSDWGNLFGAGWHTPSKDEWNYLCNTRSTASGVRYAKATVNGVPGVILLPDDWSTSYYALASTNTANAAFSANKINSTTWTNSLEAHGAVFLPIAGLRSFGNIWNVGGQGFYWSSSPAPDVNCAYTMTFHASAVEPQWYDGIYRGYGMSVRLIKDMPIDVTGVTLSPTEASLIVGETTTLTPTVAPATATDMTVTWTTSDDAVATVTDGVVTAVGAGTATITVTATNGTADTSDDKTATCTVTVNYPTYDLTANEGATGEFWATFYSDASNYEASEGTQVFKVNLDGTTITMTEITDRIVKSGQGVVLKNTSGSSITMTPTSSNSSDNYSDNSLTGTMTSITNPGNAYVLNKKDGTGVGFYRLSSGGTIGANKAYLTYSGTLAREFFLFDEATGISATLMNNEEVNGEVYDLQGRRVSQPTKGLYIVNGKKYIKK